MEPKTTTTQDTIDRMVAGQIDEVAERLACLRETGGENAVEAVLKKAGVVVMPATTHYLVHVYGDVEPELIGPMSSYDEVLTEAIRRRKDEPDDGLYYFCMKTNGTPFICAFSGGELEPDEDNDEEPGADMRIGVEVTAEDIESVLSAYSLRVTDTQGKSFETMAADLLGEIDCRRVEQAALNAGANRDDQKQAAFDEIKAILVEEGVLEF